MLSELLALVPTGSTAWATRGCMGRLGRGRADSLRARFLAAPDPELKVRWLTLLTFSADTALDPAARAGLRRARQLRRAAALRLTRVGRAALDRHPREPGGAARRA